MKNYQGDIGSENHYEILGVSREALNVDIEKAYKYGAMFWHPDKNLDNQTVATENFRKLFTAKEVLTNAITREEYDYHLHKKNKKIESDWQEPKIDEEKCNEELRKIVKFYTQAHDYKTQKGKEMAEESRKKNWVNVIRLAKSGHAFFNELSEEGFGVLHYMALYGACDAAKEFFGIGGKWNVLSLVVPVDVNIRNKKNVTPLHIAVAQNNYKMCKLLVKKNAEQQHCDEKYSSTPLHFSISNDNDEKIQKYLIDNYSTYTIFSYSSLDLRDFEGDTPLHTAIHKKKSDIAKLIIEKKVKLDLQNKDGDTPLNLALINGLFDVAELLIDKGASVQITNKKGEKSADFFNKKIPNSLKLKLVDKERVENKQSCLVM